MRIPAEHFMNIPVAALTPTTPSPCSEDEESFSKAILSRLPDIPKLHPQHNQTSTPNTTVLSTATPPASPSPHRQRSPNDSPLTVR